MNEETAPELERGGSAALRAKGYRTLTRLRRARAAAPRNPALTAPEWELLGRFGLRTIDAVRRRMAERALLAAYDGAPAALTEARVERARTPSADDGVQDPGRSYGEAHLEALLVTTLCYDPESERVCVDYTVSRRQVAVDEGGRSLETRDGEFYAVTFDPRTGGVARRERGALRQAPGEPAARRDVTVETVAPH